MNDENDITSRGEYRKRRTKKIELHEDENKSTNTSTKQKCGTGDKNSIVGVKGARRDARKRDVSRGLSDRGLSDRGLSDRGLSDRVRVEGLKG